ncbi:hypothetical protein Tco_1547355 [Tanacetum coccineum]
MKIRRIHACTHQRQQRKQAQYAVSREDQYIVLEIYLYPTDCLSLVSGKHFKTLSLDELRSPGFNLFSDQEDYLEEEVADTMAETMEKYMSKTRADYGSGVARPKTEDKDHFKLKGQFLKEYRENTFSGSNHKDANEHIEKVLEIILDSRGAIPTKTTADAKRAIQEMAEYSQKWHNGTSRGRNNETSDGLAAIQAQLNNLGRGIKKVNEKVYAAQVGCGQWELAKRHEENSKLIKEIQTSMDAAIRNQGASLKILEIQFGQLSKELQERGFGILPSSTEPNLRDHVKSILTTIKVDTHSIRCIGLETNIR